MNKLERDAAIASIWADATMTPAQKAAAVQQLPAETQSTNAPAATTVKAVAITAEQRVLLTGKSKDSTQGLGRVWEPEGLLISADPDEYRITSDIKTGRNGTFTGYQAHIMFLDTETKEQFELPFNFRSGVKPDKDRPVMVNTYRAQRNWPSDDDRQIKEGARNTFAKNA